MSKRIDLTIRRRGVRLGLEVFRTLLKAAREGIVVGVKAGHLVDAVST
jgi:hypothetical protein